MNCAQALRMLDAFVDGELDAATASEFAAHIATCAACASLHGQRIALRTALRVPALRDAAPKALRADILRHMEREATARPRSRIERGWQVLLLAGACAMAGAFGGWWIAQPPGPELMPEIAVARHVASLHPQGPRIDVASSDRHTVRPWFQGRLDFAPDVRDVSADGFELVGGRIERLAASPAAAIVYRLRNHTIEVFSWRAPAAGRSDERAATIRGFNVATWNEGDLAYAVVSDMDHVEMARFVAAFRRR